MFHLLWLLLSRYLQFGWLGKFVFYLHLWYFVVFPLSVIVHHIIPCPHHSASLYYPCLPWGIHWSGRSPPCSQNPTNHFYLRNYVLHSGGFFHKWDKNSKSTDANSQSKSVDTSKKEWNRSCALFANVCHKEDPQKKGCLISKNCRPNAPPVSLSSI